MTSQSGGTVRPTYLALEGLRGLSAIAVVLAHLGERWAVLLGHAYLAVDLFFIMSGVVISYAYENRLKAGWSWGEFCQARIVRLGPLYMMGLVIGFIAAIVATSIGLKIDGPIALSLVLGVLFVPMLWGVGDIFPLNSPSWSLFDEALANCVYAIVAPTVSNRMLQIIAFLGFASLCIVSTRSGIGANLGVSGGNWLGGVARITFGFSIGVIINRLHLSRGLVAPPIPAWALLMIVAMTFAVPGPTPIYDILVIGIVYPIVVTFGISAVRGGPREMKVYSFLGMLSYPLYILHYPIANLTQALLSEWRGRNEALVLVGEIGCLVVCIALAVVMSQYFDKPVRLALQRVLKGR